MPPATLMETQHVASQVTCENPNLTSSVIYIDINAESPKQDICCPSDAHTHLA